MNLLKKTSIQQCAWGPLQSPEVPRSAADKLPSLRQVAMCPLVNLTVTSQSSFTGWWPMGTSTRQETIIQTEGGISNGCQLQSTAQQVPALVLHWQEFTLCPGGLPGMWACLQVRSVHPFWLGSHTFAGSCEWRVEASNNLGHICVCFS